MYQKQCHTFDENHVGLKKKTHKYQRPANFGTVGLSLTISIYWNCNLLLFINFFTHFSLAFRDFSDVLYYKKD